MSTLIDWSVPAFMLQPWQQGLHKVFVLTPSQNTRLPISDYYDGRIRKKHGAFPQSLCLDKNRVQFLRSFSSESLEVLHTLVGERDQSFAHTQRASIFPLTCILILQTSKLLSWSWQSCSEFCTHWKAETLDSVSVWHCFWGCAYPESKYLCFFCSELTSVSGMLWAHFCSFCHSVWPYGKGFTFAMFVFVDS